MGWLEECQEGVGNFEKESAKKSSTPIIKHSTPITLVEMNQDYFLDIPGKQLRQLTSKELIEVRYYMEKKHPERVVAKNKSFRVYDREKDGDGN